MDSVKSQDMSPSDLTHWRESLTPADPCLLLSYPLSPISHDQPALRVAGFDPMTDPARRGRLPPGR